MTPRRPGGAQPSDHAPDGRWAAPVLRLYVVRGAGDCSARRPLVSQRSGVRVSSAGPAPLMARRVCPTASMIAMASIRPRCRPVA